jgi:hypothetical protein
MGIKKVALESYRYVERLSRTCDIAKEYQVISLEDFSQDRE